ncbi:MAG: hypothetical protein LKK19_06665 [Bacteroidales bacterium]|jgi:hypothetical protein|nr:hypothetical protein [Bacteroidales bacterium]MCI2122367.1 hypothetical protein [Bacteroidales bacterium]MCI2146269.1 hypothetical protein [Bacteroidales bacterium]
MNGKIFLKLLPILLIAAVVTSCVEKQKETETSITIDVTDVTASSATLSITQEGAIPQLIRMVDAVSMESLDSADVNVEDESSLSAYLTDKGTAISVPYSATATGLEPYAEYVVGVVCFDADFKVTCVKYATFTTLAPDNAIGDNDGAGSVTENQW